MRILPSTGREIDDSCPLLEAECWANQGCIYGPCPDTVIDALIAAAKAEHALGWLPHTDPDIIDVCKECRNGKT